MGGRRNGVDLAGPLALDGVYLAPRAGSSSIERWSGLRSPGAGAWRRACRRAGPDAADGSRNVLDKMANAVVHDVFERASLPPSFAPSSLAEIVMVFVSGA
jgi:hypothetical protein